MLTALLRVGSFSSLGLFPPCALPPLCELLPLWDAPFHVGFSPS